MKISALTEKTTPVNADSFPMTDSAASNATKKVTWANIKATLKAYFDTLYHSIGGTDVPITDGGTGASTAAAARTAFGVGTGDTPTFAGITTTASISSGLHIGVAGSYYIGAIGSAPILDSTTGAIIRWRDSTGAAAAGFIGVKTVVEAKTGAYTVVVLDSGKTFTNEGTTSRVDFTLPVPVAGLIYRFTVQDTDGIRVIPNTSCTIRIGASVSGSGAAGRIDATAIGSVITLEAINTTQWIAVANELTWAVT